MLHFRPVLSFREFEAVRRIYNESLEYMTKPLKQNTLEEQLDWWLGEPRGVRVGLDDKKQVIGYVMVTRHYMIDGHFASPMFAIAKEHRGKGYARQFIKFYLREAFGPLVGEQLKTNETIRRLNAEAGWIIVSEKDGVEFLFHPGTRDNEDVAMRYLAWRAS